MTASAQDPEVPTLDETAPPPDGEAGDQLIDQPGEADAPAAEPRDPLTTAIIERDEYLDSLRRLQADFENYKKRMAKQQAEYLDRAAEALVLKLLPVLDIADLAVSHRPGGEAQQVWAALSDALAKEGLERIDQAGDPFDPTRHDAVAHEPVEGDGHEEPKQVVAEVMRAGYRWRGRVLRPAMVKVRG